MIGILFTHSIQAFSVHFFNENNIFIGTTNEFIFYSALINIGKFATIVFFIISGFLFQLNEHKYSSFKAFINNKYQKLLKPYLIIFLIPILIYNLPIKPFISAPEHVTVLVYVVNILKKIFFSNYWFIPVLFIYFIGNFFLPFRYMKWVFPVAVLITIFYSFNLYNPIIPTSHTLGFLGFCSFFFLGRIMVNLKPLSSITNSWAIISLCICGFLFSIIETCILHYSFSQADCWNTLKISNIFYSLTALLLLKDKVIMPSYLLKVDTYMIYLFHPHLKGIILKAIVYMEGEGLIASRNQFTTFSYVIIFLLLCYFMERIYSKIKSQAFQVNIFKASFLLRGRS